MATGRRPIALFAAAVLLALSAVAAADQRDPQLAPLFERLRAAPGESEAQVIENTIWLLWSRAGIERVDAAMAHGVVAMNEGRLADALAFFDDVVRRVPDFAEGWNKRATVRYLMGDYNGSVVDIERTLALEPRHFGALSGLGLIYDAIGNGPAAVKAWTRALEINPHMPSIRERMKALRQETEGKPI